MKKIVSILVLIFSLVVFSSQAFTCEPVSTCGKADIPYWWYYWAGDNDYQITTFTITNRSENSVNATLSLRGSDGDPVTSSIVYVDYSYQSAASATATIPAYETKVFYLTGVTQDPAIYGGGTVSWGPNDSTDCCCRPLAVVVEKQCHNSTNTANSMYKITVENGETWF